MSLSSTSISALKCQPKAKRSTEVSVASGFKDAGFIFLARARVPDWAGKIKLAEDGSGLRASELDRVHHGAGQVDGGDVKSPGGSWRDVAYGPVSDLPGSTLPSQRSTHSATSRSVAARGATTAKKSSAAMSLAHHRDILLDADERCGENCRIPHARSALLRRLILIWFGWGALWAQSGDFRDRRSIPVLEKANCRACHNPDGVASATRLHFPEADASAGKDRGVRKFAGGAGGP